MGPPFITAEWRGFWHDVDAVIELQWGRRSSRRSGAKRRGTAPITSPASMGPPFITAEWPHRSDAREWHGGGFNGAAVHHGGVASW